MNSTVGGVEVLAVGGDSGLAASTPVLCKRPFPLFLITVNHQIS
jgi:hypothetical protein